MSWLTDEDGFLLVRIARRTIEEYLRTGEILPIEEEIRRRFSEKMGVFVTVDELVRGRRELRGCIGFPMPIYPLIDAIQRAAISAATEDPRFRPLALRELGRVVLEVSVLTPPELISVRSPREYLSEIRVGRDGLILEWKYGAGLLLPQVPVEYKWNAEEYLAHLSLKAGGAADLWLAPGVKIYRFEALIWEEEEPGGVVRRKILAG